MVAPMLALGAARTGLNVAQAIATYAGQSAPAGSAEAKARKTAVDFETMFLEQTFDQVFSSTGEEGPLGENGTGGGIYRSMLSKEYAGQVVKSGGIGLSDLIYREILRLQEKG